MSRRTRRRILIGGSLLATISLCGGCGTTSPAASARAGDTTIVRITVTPSSCRPVPSLVPAGTVEVIATNLDAPTVSEVEIRSGDLSRVLGEKENLIQGMSTKFSMSLGEGSFVVNCPGAADSHWPLKVERPRR